MEVTSGQALNPTSRSRRWSVLGLSTLGSWLMLAGTWFFQNYLWSAIWVLFLGVIAIAAFVAAGLTVGWAVRSAIRGRYLQGLLILGVAGLIAAVIAFVPWGDVYGRVWFALHRDDFVRVEALVRDGDLDPTLDYYGSELPAGLAGISITGQVSATSTWAGDEESTPCDEPIEFIPAAVGIPDGGVGFVHLPCDAPPRGFMVNGYDDGMVPRISLGSGWWWADGVVPDGYLDE
jgi:hypothetical protein